LIKTYCKAIIFVVNGLKKINEERKLEMEYLDQPTYAPTFTAKLVGLSSHRVRRWLRGYSYDNNYKFLKGSVNIKTKIPAVVKRDGTQDSKYASFLDLIDLLFIKHFITSGISLQKLRLALSESESILGGHHFAQREFFTHGKSIYLKVKNKGGAITELLSGGQWAIAPIIEQTAKRIDFSEVHGYAERWYPLVDSKNVVIDPLVSYGSPSLKNKNLKTSIIYDLFLSENKNVEKVCSWMEITMDEALSAIKFEQTLLKN